MMKKWTHCLRRWLFRRKLRAYGLDSEYTDYQLDVLMAYMLNNKHNEVGKSP